MFETNKMVYLVDDNEPVREALKWLLTTIGLEVTTFESAIEFLHFYDIGCQGCLITDVRMPIMSGLELIERLQSLQSKLSVIVITGHGDIPMAVRAMKAGAVDFLTKPFNEQHLIDLIYKLLRTIPC